MTTRQRVGPVNGYAQVGRAVAELNAAIRGGRDGTEILGRICAQARALTGALTATAMTLDEDGVLVVRAVAGRPGGWVRGMRVPVDDTLAGNALRRRGPEAAGLRRCRHRHEQAVAAAGLRRVLYVPIPGYGSVTGVLGLGYRRGGTQTGRDVCLLEPLAAVAGLVPADPSRPCDVTGLAGTAGRDQGRLRERLQVLVDRVVTLTGALDCAVYLPDGQFGLTPVAVAAAPVTPTGRRRPDSWPGNGGGPADPLTVAQLLAERRPSTLWRTPGGSLLCVPLPVGGSLLGALGARWPPDTEPVAAERMLLNLTAGEAAYVVDCSRRRAADEAQAAAREREWLARELHDSVVQTLYGISLGASTASELLRQDPAQAQQPIAWIQKAALASLTDLRGLILRLRPEALAGNGLAAALGRLLETLHTLDGCRTTAELGPEPIVTAEVRQALYRIAQEAIQNAAKHARAGQVTLRLVTRGTKVVLEVVDDGRGFTVSDETLVGEFPGRFGIRSMRERAEGAGGRLDVISAPGRGTLVRAELPAGI
jgi:signal transduction histidine kinase